MFCLRYVILLLIITAIWPVPEATAQSNREQLERLSALPDDTVKIKQLYELGFTTMGTDTLVCRGVIAAMRQSSEQIHWWNGVALTNNLEGNLLRMQGRYINALNCHRNALIISDSLHDTYMYISALVNTGTDYVQLKRSDKALLYYRKALGLINPATDKRFVSVSNNMGIVYMEQGNYRAALDVFKRALPYADADSTCQSQANLYSNIGIVYMRLDAFPQASTYLKKALDFQLKTGNLQHYAATLNTLGSLLIGMKQFDDAGTYLKRGYEVASRLGARSVIANYYRNMGLLCRKTNRHKEAYEWIERYVYLNDSLLNESDLQQLADAEARYNLDVKSRELQLAHTTAALKDSELKRTWLWLLLSLLLLLTAIAIVFLLYRNARLRRLMNEHLATENRHLQAENILSRYEVLRSQINPHFLFNSLNALNSLIHTDMQKAADFITVFSRLFRNVLAEDNQDVVTLSQELSLADDFLYLQQIRFGHNLKVVKQIDPAMYHWQIPPFCLQMIIENAIKHNVIEQDTPLHITIIAQHGTLQVINSLHPKSRPEPGTGIGLNNIRARFAILHSVQPTFEAVGQKYIATLPLIEPRK